MDDNDEDHDLIYEGALLGRHHRVVEFLGEGGFGLVFNCWNRQSRQMEALKLIRYAPESIQQVKVEVANLKRLQCLDPDACNIVRWYDFFFHMETICLTFELLDLSLWDYMKERPNQGLPMSEIRPVTHQMATALIHLKSIGIVHADLKPDNIMIVDRRQQPLKVKLTDFGLAYPSSGSPGVVVQTLFYRSPEVILGICFSEVIDMWSLGVTIAELATGRTLYPGDACYDVLNLIVKTQGQPADYLLNRGRATKDFFVQSSGQPQWIFLNSHQYEEKTGYCPKDRRTMKLRSLDDLRKFMLVESGDQRDQLLLVNLIKKMTDLDPKRRIKPHKVLEHPFLATDVPQSSINDKGTRGNVKETAADGHHSFPYNIGGAENLYCALEITTNASAAGWEDGTNDIQPAHKVGWFRRLARSIADTYHTG